MDWSNKFAVTNKSGTILLAGILDIPHNAVDMIINPKKYSTRLVDDLKIYLSKDMILVTNDFVETPDTKQDTSGDNNVSSVKSLGGHDHLVFDFKESNKAINVNEIDTSSSPIVEESLITEDEKAITVREHKVIAEDKMTKEEAISLINLHWKKFEQEVKKIDDIKKLNFLQVVAIEISAAAKKKEIIEDRIKSL